MSDPTQLEHKKYEMGFFNSAKWNKARTNYNESDFVVLFYFQDREVNGRYVWEFGIRSQLEGSHFILAAAFPIPSIPLQ